MHVIGDLAGAPVIKLAMGQGHEVIEHIAALPDMKQERGNDVIDVLVIGAGAAGLNAALAAKDHDLSTVIIEKGRIAQTIDDFPEGKWVYAEPDDRPPKGKLWLDGARNCQVGIDVMRYALKQEKLDNETSSCIGCGICVTVCPMDVLSFGKDKVVSLPVINGR